VNGTLGGYETLHFPRKDRNMPRLSQSPETHLDLGQGRMASASIGMGAASIRERTLHMNARIIVMLMAAASDARAAEPGGDPTVGGAIFQRICQNCHSGETGVNKVGPSLWDVVGREAGTVPGFEYSDALKANKAAWTTSFLDPCGSSGRYSRCKDVLQGIAGGQGSRRRHRLSGDSKIGIAGSVRDMRWCLQLMQRAESGRPPTEIGREQKDSPAHRESGLPNVSSVSTP
jgi:cytochrome c2